jgi:ferritin-like metal-binding protein YciE
MKNSINKADKSIVLQEAKVILNESDLIPKKEYRNIFIEELKEIYFSEKALLISIPILIKNAATEELATALQVHLQFTEEHTKGLEDFFNSIGEANIILKYDAMYCSSSPQKQ